MIFPHPQRRSHFEVPILDFDDDDEITNERARVVHHCVSLLAHSRTRSQNSISGASFSKKNQNSVASVCFKSALFQLLLEQLSIGSQIKLISIV